MNTIIIAGYRKSTSCVVHAEANCSELLDETGPVIPVATEQVSSNDPRFAHLRMCESCGKQKVPVETTS